MGFERNYQVKNPSNLIIQRRLYSHHYHPHHSHNHNGKYVPVKALFKPEYKISGFTGCEADKNLTNKHKHTQLNEP